ncbi:MAG: hypothetical protein ACREYE_01180 [Gammaproteobacteria bacterium]
MRGLRAVSLSAKRSCAPAERDLPSLATVFSQTLTALFRDSDTEVDFGKDERYFVAPSFTWRPSEDTTFTFLSHYQKDETGNTVQNPPAEGTLLPKPNGKIPTSRGTGEPGFDRFDREQFGVGYAFEHRFNDTWRVRQNLRYAAGGCALNPPSLPPASLVCAETPAGCG